MCCSGNALHGNDAGKPLTTLPTIPLRLQVPKNFSMWRRWPKSSYIKWQAVLMKTTSKPSMWMGSENLVMNTKYNELTWCTV